jgi:hypothetical protein
LAGSSYDVTQTQDLAGRAKRSQDLSGMRYSLNEIAIAHAIHGRREICHLSLLPE